MDLSAEDRERVSRAVRAAEDKTSGEIVCVLAQSSATPTALPVTIAAAVALILPWLLVAFTAMPVYRILALQLIAFVAVLLLVGIPRVQLLLLPRRTQRQVAYRAAMEQFVIRGIARKNDRCGILIFVSLAERYARIIADDGIAAKVPQSAWQAAVDTLIAHAREDQIAEGFIAAIDLCGAELAKHFPRTAPKSEELSDRVYLI
jgi:putative membrane protein